MPTIKKFKGIEPQLASSILYYDKDELTEFLKIYEQQISQNNSIIVDGIFDKFVSYLRKFDNFDDDPETRKNNIVLYLNLCNSQNPDKNSRETFDLWLNNVLKLNVNMELANDILSHFLWESYKQTIDLLDKSNIPFNEKLSVRPPQISTLNSNDEIVSLDDIIPQEESEKTPYTTGLEQLDKLVEFCKTNFVVVAARPGVGKSLFMMQSAVANAKNGVKTLYLSLEMGKEQLDARIVNHHAGENLKDRSRNDYGILDFESYKNEYATIKASRSFKQIKQNLQLYITKASSADAILDRLEQQIKENHYEAIFVDYLQLLKYNRLDEWASLRNLTNALKNLAFRLNVLVVTGSQVSRSSTEHGLYLSDLFGSSSIESDTDIVIGLENQKERRQGERAVINVKVLKNREGDLGEISCIAEYSVGRITEK